jgi:hypothetical protein
VKRNKKPLKTLCNYLEKAVVNKKKEIRAVELTCAPIDQLQPTNEEQSAKIGGYSVKDIIIHASKKIGDNKVLQKDLKHNLKMDVRFINRNFLYFNTSVQVNNFNISLHDIVDDDFISVENFKGIKLESSILKILHDFDRFKHKIYSKPQSYNILYKSAIAIIYLTPHYLSRTKNPNNLFLQNNELTDGIYNDFLIYFFNQVDLDMQNYVNKKRAKNTSLVIGKFKFLFFLSPFLRHCDLSQFSIDCAEFYDNLTKENTYDQLLEFVTVFCNELNINIIYYSIDTLLSSIATNYCLREEKNIFKTIKVHNNIQRLYSDFFLFFKINNRDNFTLINLIRNKLEGYNLLSILTNTKNYIFEEGATATVIEFDFEFAVDITDNEIVKKYDARQFSKTKSVKENEIIYLIYKRTETPRIPIPANRFFNNKFIFLLSIFQALPSEESEIPYEDEDNFQNYAFKGFIECFFAHEKLPLVHRSLQNFYAKLTNLETNNQLTMPRYLTLFINKCNVISTAFTENQICSEKIHELQTFNVNDIDTLVKNSDDPFLIIHCLNSDNIIFNLTLLKSFPHAEILSVLFEEENKLLRIVNDKVCYFENNVLSFVKSCTINCNMYISTKKS